MGSSEDLQECLLAEQVHQGLLEADLQVYTSCQVELQGGSSDQEDFKADASCRGDFESDEISKKLMILVFTSYLQMDQNMTLALQFMQLSVAIISILMLRSLIYTLIQSVELQKVLHRV